MLLFFFVFFVFATRQRTHFYVDICDREASVNVQTTEISMLKYPL